MLETLKADADLVGSLENEMGASLTSDEELAILREFEGETEAPTPERAAPAPPVASPPESAADASRAEPAAEPPSPAPSQPDKQKDAEAT